ncbi:hypothetical protein DMX04_27130 [Pseudomonas koreensis]|nr:hypothetical protein DMX04_27130 [Pseudomonas koreensis]
MARGFFNQVRVAGIVAGSSESWVQGCQLSVALSADPGSPRRTRRAVSNKSPHRASPTRPDTTVPCRSCRRLRSFDLDLDLDLENQKIAAFGSSYTGDSCTYQGIVSPL